MVAKEKFSLKLIGFLAGFQGLTAYGVILGVLLACGLGVPVPEDITLIAAGILAALGNITLFGALIVGFAGVLMGDCILFFMGRLYGYRVFKLPGFRRIFTEARIQMARQKVLSNSKFICFTARFLPGLRAPIFLTSGILGVHPFVFLILDGLAAMISVPIWIYLGWYVGDNLDHALLIAGQAQKYILVVFVIVLGAYMLYRRHRRAKEAEALKISGGIPSVAAPDESLTPESIAPSDPKL